MRSLARRLATDESGSTAMWVAATIAVFVAAASLTLDGGLLYLTKNRLQVAADAAALAGASQLTVSDSAVQTAAIAVTNLNLPNQSALVAADVQTGTWANNAFTANTTPKNAVRVTVRRTVASNNPVTMVFGGGGSARRNVIATAVAARQGGQPDACYTFGFVAAGQVLFNSGNRATNMCFHGQNNVVLNSGLTFTNSKVTTNNPNFGPDNRTSAEKAQMTVGIRSLLPVDAQNLATRISALENGTGPYPSYLDGTVIRVQNFPSNYVQGKFYIVQNTPNLSGNYQNVGIYSKQGMNLNGNSSFQNVLLISEGNMNVNTPVSLGDPNYCSTGNGSVLIMTKQALNLNGGTAMYGLQVLSSGTVTLNSTISTAYTVTVQSAQDIITNMVSTGQCNYSNFAFYTGGAGSDLSSKSKLVR
ncbi:MAG: pilus assembly protein TadG-related protein [Sphingomonadaceae bacterium]|nr:pilus assembly protein TadG-related protein [Sphingomonadaceae bacterium]